MMNLARGGASLNLGLKLYSTNLFYIPKAASLYAEGVFQYIELYVEPGTTVEQLPAWERLDIPMVLHAPHSLSGLNLSLKESEADNRQLISQVETFHRALHPRWVIFHSGTNGTVDETIRQLKMFKSDFPTVFEGAVVENKPRKGLKGEYCIGASPEELERIILETGLGFCLDFGHAICHAATAGENDMRIIDRFVRLKPALFHISDGYVTSERDSHLHFGDGDFRIDALLGKMPPGSWLSIETQKDESLDLEDFRKDMQFLEKLVLAK